MAATLLFSQSEQALAATLVQQARETAQVYEGNYRAPWLLSSSIYCDVWSLRKDRGETRTVNGEVVGDREFDWRVRLPNGELLTHDRNAHLLQALQRVGFLARATPGGPETLGTHLNFLWTLSFLARWAVLREADLNPQKHALSRLTHDHFSDLIRDLATGGVAFALHFPQCFLRRVYPAAMGKDPSTADLAAPLNLDQNDCSRVGIWLRESGHLRPPKRHSTAPPSLDLAFVAELISADFRTVSSPKFAAFLSQFTVGPLDANHRVMRGIGDCRREFASHKALTARQLALLPASEKTVGKYLTDLRTAVSLHRHLPNDCPDPCEFRYRQLNTIASRLCRPREATPWVPLTTALEYTKEALRWIHVYGDSLVDLFLNAYARLYRAGLLGPPVIGTEAEQATAYKRAAKARAKIVDSIPVPSTLTPLNLSGWNSYVHLDGDAGFEQLRNAPSMLDAIMVLVAAIAIITGALKPMRESELRHLRRDCVFFVKGDGFWLSASQSKRSIAGIAPHLRRPIPSIAARGLLLLKKLTDGLKKIIGVEDPWLLESIFAMPTLSVFEARISDVITAGQLMQLLDTFCDRVALPPDSLGRRWYLRIHELRKSFLIVFFWTYRYANLDAAAWMAGHTDVGQLYAYLQANFPGQELPALEAEYASMVLRDGIGSERLENAEALHEAVCRQFSVRDVSWIDDQSLQDWLTSRFASGDFEIRPYSLPTRSGKPDVHIAFRVREAK